MTERLDALWGRLLPARRERSRACGEVVAARAGSCVGEVQRGDRVACTTSSQHAGCGGQRRLCRSWSMCGGTPSLVGRIAVPTGLVLQGRVRHLTLLIVSGRFPRRADGPTECGTARREWNGQELAASRPNANRSPAHGRQALCADDAGHSGNDPGVGGESVFSRTDPARVSGPRRGRQPADVGLCRVAF